MRVTIWHRTGERMFSPLPIERDETYTLAYSYERGPLEGADPIYRENNVVDGSEYPVTYGTRSLSVGDVIEFDDFIDLATGATSWEDPDYDPALTWMVGLYGYERVAFGSAWTDLWRIRAGLTEPGRSEADRAIYGDGPDDIDLEAAMENEGNS